MFLKKEHLISCFRNVEEARPSPTEPPPSTPLPPPLSSPRPQVKCLIPKGFSYVRMEGLLTTLFGGRYRCISLLFPVVFGVSAQGPEMGGLSGAVSPQ